MSHQDTSSRELLWDLIKDIKFGMFTTRHGNGHLHSRPMATQNKGVDEDSSLWFFMSRSGSPLADLITEPSVNVAYADPGKDSYVSVSGTARVWWTARPRPSSCGASSTKPGFQAACAIRIWPWYKCKSRMPTTGT